MNGIAHWLSRLQPGEQLNLIAYLGAAVAFAVGWWQYRNGQRWRRMEWIAKEMDVFFADSIVVAAQQMIDWGSRPIELHPTREDLSEKIVIVDDPMVTGALVHHSHKIGGFDPNEAAIRDIFDHYLDRLERISSFVEARLLSVKDVRPYLRYWAYQIITARSGDVTVRRIVQLRRFIRDYGYVGVQKLFANIAHVKWPNDSPADPYAASAALLNERPRGASVRVRSTE